MVKVNALNIGTLSVYKATNAKTNLLCSLMNTQKLHVAEILKA